MTPGALQSCWLLLVLPEPKTELSEALDYMQEHMEEEVLRDRAVVQTPVLRKLLSGDDVILSPVPVSPRPWLLEGAAKLVKPVSQAAEIDESEAFAEVKVGVWIFDINADF